MYYIIRTTGILADHIAFDMYNFVSYDFILTEAFAIDIIIL